MKFTKMHGLGNDYVFIEVADQALADASGLARAVADRHTGIGSDGLILIGPSEAADVRMEMYNADGSRAQMCGNGIRCVAKYAYEQGLAKHAEMVIQTDDGPKTACCILEAGRVVAVRVNMGKPSFTPDSLPSSIHGREIVDYPLGIGGAVYTVTCVSMGNPHAVVFVEDLTHIALHDVGPRLESAPEFPERINAHFVQVDSPSHLTMLSWERGSGATRACGTGACAAVVAASVTNRCGRDARVTLAGGELEIVWEGDGHVYMTGPAIEVFRGTFDDGGRRWGRY